MGRQVESLHSKEVISLCKKLDFYDKQISDAEATISSYNSRLAHLKKSKMIAEYDLWRQKEKEDKNAR